MMNTAKKIAPWKGRPEGDCAVYELDPPIEWKDDETLQYVIVSAVPFVLVGDPETYIFPAKKCGDIFDIDDWLELEGSFRGDMDHARALRGLGYEIVS
jgi:hypothetical protein